MLAHGEAVRRNRGFGTHTQTSPGRGAGRPANRYTDHSFLRPYRGWTVGGFPQGFAKNGSTLGYDPAPPTGADLPLSHSYWG